MAGLVTHTNRVTFAPLLKNNSFRKCDQPDVLRNIALEWIKGAPFYELFDILLASGARRIAGTRRQRYKLENMVDICENAFSYDGTLVLGAVAELSELMFIEDAGNLIDTLRELQKRLKYGLPSPLSIALHELGFADRVVSMELALIIDGTRPEKRDVIQAITWQQEEILNRLGQYPSYFSEVYRNLTT